VKRLGIDLGELANDQNIPFHPPTCPGARVHVTRDDLTQLVQGGEQFEPDNTFVPREGYGPARVRCGRTIPGFMGVAGHQLFAGLCPSCSGLEADNRAMLASRQGSR
jgi:hypothetical protein